MISITLTLLLILASCNTQIPPSSDISEEGIPTITPSSSMLVPQLSPSPSSSLEDKPSPQASASPSDDILEGEKTFNIITGHYMEEGVTEDRTYKLSSWYDSTFGWLNAAKPYYSNGIIMGALSEFANAFNYTIESVDNSKFILEIANDSKIVFSIDSDIVEFNNTKVSLDHPTTYKNTSPTGLEGLLFIPLQCVADITGLYTRNLYDDAYNVNYLWISECAILDEKEFIPNDNFEFLTEGEWYLDGHTGFYYNKYQLKDSSATYSGVKLGDSYEEVLSTLGAPEYQETFIIEQSDNNGDSRISYTLNPQSMNDFASSIDIYFEDGVVKDVFLVLTVWDDEKEAQR
jgi:hypothetical protein